MPVGRTPSSVLTYAQLEFFVIIGQSHGGQVNNWQLSSSYKRLSQFGLARPGTTSDESDLLDIISGAQFFIPRLSKTVALDK